MAENAILVAGLRDMIRSGRLTESDIPDDFDWLQSAIEEVEPGTKGLCGLLVRRLDARRRSVAQELFDDHTFSGPVVDVGGWEIDGSYWKRDVFLRVEKHAPTLRVWFHVQFRYGTSLVEGSGCNVDL